nr:molybdopterin-guanine dinucleotide biosynthesis protein MobB [Halalkalibacter krulwichiae]
MEKVIKECTSLGWDTATIKHHGHHTSLKKEIVLKDSERHEQAGASMTAVEGGGALQLHIKNQTWSLKKLILLYQHFSPDVILVEGFKKESYPKVVLIRGIEDVKLLEKLENIVCVITWKPVQLETRHYPIYNLDDSSDYLNYIIQKLSD